MAWEMATIIPFDAQPIDWNFVPVLNDNSITNKKFCILHRDCHPSWSRRFGFG
jgi:hypothetical protein